MSLLWRKFSRGAALVVDGYQFQQSWLCCFLVPKTPEPTVAVKTRPNVKVVPKTASKATSARVVDGYLTVDTQPLASVDDYLTYNSAANRVSRAKRPPPALPWPQKGRGRGRPQAESLPSLPKRLGFTTSPKFHVLQLKCAASGCSVETRKAKLLLGERTLSLKGFHV